MRNLLAQHNIPVPDVSPLTSDYVETSILSDQDGSGRSSLHLAFSPRDAGGSTVPSSVNSLSPHDAAGSATNGSVYDPQLVDIGLNFVL